MDSFLVTLLLLGWNTTETKATYKKNIDRGSRFQMARFHDYHGREYGSRQADMVQEK